MNWLSDGGIALARAANPSANLGLFVPPGATAKDTYMTLFPFDTLVVNKKSPNLAAADAFVDFIAREKQSRLFSKILGEVDPYTYQSIFKKPKTAATLVDSIHQAVVPYAATNRIRVSGNATWPTSDVYVAIGTAVQGIFTGQTASANDVLKAADEAWAKPR